MGPADAPGALAAAAAAVRAALGRGGGARVDVDALAAMAWRAARKDADADADAAEAGDLRSSLRAALAREAPPSGDESSVAVVVVEAVARAVVEAAGDDRDLELELVLVEELLFGAPGPTCWGSAGLERWLVERIARAEARSRAAAIHRVVERTASARRDGQIEAALRFVASLLGHGDVPEMDAASLEDLTRLCVDNVHAQGCIGMLLPRVCGSFGLVLADETLMDTIALKLWDDADLLESLRRLTLVFAACERRRAVETRLLVRLRADDAVWKAIRHGLEVDADMPNRQALYLLETCVSAGRDLRWRKLVEILKGLAQMERSALKRVWTQLVNVIVAKESAPRSGNEPAFGWAWCRIALYRALRHRNKAFANECSLRLLDFVPGKGVFAPDLDFLQDLVLTQEMMALVAREQAQERLKRFLAHFVCEDNATSILLCAARALGTADTFLAARPLCTALAQRTPDGATLGVGVHQGQDELEVLCESLEQLAPLRKHPVFGAALEDQQRVLCDALETFAVADGCLELVGRLAYILHQTGTPWHAWSRAPRAESTSLSYESALREAIEPTKEMSISPRALAGLITALLPAENGQIVFTSVVAAWSQRGKGEQLALAHGALCPIISYGIENPETRPHFEHGFFARPECLQLLDWAQETQSASLFSALAKASSFADFGPRLSNALARAIENARVAAADSPTFWALVRVGASVMPNAKWESRAAQLFADFQASTQAERWHALGVFLRNVSLADEAKRALWRALESSDHSLETSMGAGPSPLWATLLSQATELLKGPGGAEAAQRVGASPLLTYEEKAAVLFQSGADIVRSADIREAVLRDLWIEAGTRQQQGRFTMVAAILDAMDEEAWTNELLETVTQHEGDIEGPACESRDGLSINMDAIAFQRMACLKFLASISDRNPAWALAFAQRLKDMAFTHASASTGQRCWAARALCVLGANLRGVTREAIAQLFEEMLRADFEGLRDKLELRWILETAMLALVLLEPVDLLPRLVVEVETCADLEQLLSYVYVLTSAVYFVTDADIAALRASDPSGDLIAKIMRAAVAWAASENLSIRTLGPALLAMFVERGAWGVTTDDPFSATLVNFVAKNLHAKKTADKVISKVECHGMNTMGQPQHHFSLELEAALRPWTLSWATHGPPALRASPEEASCIAARFPSRLSGGLPHGADSAQEVERSGELLASLVSKVPNVAGLIRTTDFLGLREITISQMRYCRNAGFPGIACSAEDFVPVKEVAYADLGAYIRARKAAGCRVLALEQAAESVSIEKYEFPQDAPVCFLLGMEKEGVPMHLLNLVDDCIEIPQFGLTRSLNVHASGAILLWEFVKQRRGAGTGPA